MLSLDNALAHVSQLGRAGMKFDLDRIRAVMRVLGSPQDAFPAVHIAGTNGKGSVAAMTASALATAGYRTGLYTSPHLERLSERFQINAQPISDNALLSAITAAHSAVGDIQKRDVEFGLTQFEFLTAMAFWWFASEKVDVAVVEVGLGGRLDATNVLGRVLVSVITNIGLDHTEWLGTTLSAIAKEKAGICRPGVPVVTAATGEALTAVRGVVSHQLAPLTLVSRPLSTKQLPASFPLIGDHQRWNAAVAVETLRLVAERQFPLSSEDIQCGLAATSWPGRYECFEVGTAHGSRRVILDGAHNPPAMKALARALTQEKETQVELLFGALKDKDLASLVATLAPFSDRVRVAPVPSPRSADPADLAALAGWKNAPQTFASIEQALAAWAVAPSKHPLLVTGSLYLVGEARKHLKSPSFTRRKFL